MNFISGLLQILFFVTVTTKCFTSAMICNKLLIDSGATGNTGVSKEIMENGRYEIRLSTSRNSSEVQSLIAKLDGARDIQYKSKRFTAILQPKDLKKVAIATCITDDDSVTVKTVVDSNS